MLPHTSGRIQIDPDAHAGEASPGLVMQPDPDFMRSSREPAWDTGSTSALRVVAVMRAAAERGVEHIELSSTDTAAQALTETDSQPIDPGGTALLERLIELERQNRTLAADLAELRAQLEARDIEHATEIAIRDGEISRLSDEVMSVTLERDGLKARWRETEHVRGGSGHNTAPAAPVAAADMQQVERLKERLAERAHAIAAAREEIDFLNSERQRLIAQVAALSRQPGQPADMPQPPAADVEDEQEPPESGLRAVVRRLSRSFNRRSAASAATGPATVQSPSAQDTPVPQRPRATPPQEPAPARVAHVPAPAMVQRGPPAAPAAHAADRAQRRSLVMLDGRPGTTFELKSELVSVGRGQKADISLADPSVSRLHAVLRHGEAGVLVEDLASANGVFVNGQAVRLHVLHDGDEVAFGNVRFTYRAGS